jgi:class 3 adenylate cyclase
VESHAAASEVVTMEPRWRHIVGRTVHVSPGERRAAALEPRGGDGPPVPIGPSSGRLLAAVLSLDVVDSTGHAVRLGDDRWLDVLVAYHAVARRQVGLHQGSVVSIAGDAIHICARVAAKARPGEILVTGTVKDLVAGTPLAFQERDAHQLRGIEGSWPLFAVTGYRPGAHRW